MRPHHVHSFRGNTKMVAIARSLGINVVQTRDALLTAEVQHIYWERWNAENKAAIDPSTTTTPASQPKAFPWNRTALFKCDPI